MRHSGMCGSSFADRAEVGYRLGSFELVAGRNGENNGRASSPWRHSYLAGLLNYEVVERYSDTYTQQSLVNSQAATYLRDVYRSSASFQGGRSLHDLESAEVDATIANLQQTMADLKFLRDLSDGLSRDFERDDSETH